MMLMMMMMMLLAVDSDDKEHTWIQSVRGEVASRATPAGGLWQSDHWPTMCTLCVFVSVHCSDVINTSCVCAVIRR